jgi:hypothetical protein
VLGDRPARAFAGPFPDPFEGRRAPDLLSERWQACRLPSTPHSSVACALDPLVESSWHETSLGRADLDTIASADKLSGASDSVLDVNEALFGGFPGLGMLRLHQIAGRGLAYFHARFWQAAAGLELFP